MQEMYVVQGLRQPLVGCPAIAVVTRIESVTSENQRVVALLPNVFQGLGRIEGEFKIKLKDNPEPFSLMTPRRVALPLLPKVKEELLRMEKLGVIYPVNEPTEWCSGMVVVPKPNDSVRISVDLTKLNENVMRERHIMPLWAN
jgi:hypothetical protein